MPRCPKNTCSAPCRGPLRNSHLRWPTEPELPSGPDHLIPASLEKHRERQTVALAAERGCDPGPAIFGAAHMATVLSALGGGS